ncbi:CDP-diacylglycerol--glycerol-3-phosphate 3-phosphatidyltransferase [Peribacillus sp. SCS-155]|uniref:CDP-diacylglycerol--glycerol-3-phosphate 3-phosphatidyltransferase n=1 Tax=Peribacillus sedimenti TaxID=3115297 RepID=UPI0039062324
MNLPNKITISRILMIPVFVILMLVPFPWEEWRLGDESIAVSHVIGTLVFIIASATDWIDGYYARKFNLVTNMGKFLDPLADKLLVAAALVVLVDLDLMYGQSWIAIVIISREFAVTGLRLLLADTGEVVAANMLGKIKTWTQIVAISALLLNNLPFSLIHFPFANIALWVSLIFTVWSGWDYFAKNKAIFKNSK